MELLRRKRIEIAWASEESELLSRLRINTSEYDLIRKIDLSFDNLHLTALHFRSYMRLCQEVANIPRYDPQCNRDYDFINSYYDNLGSLYYAWACSYLEQGYYLDNTFHHQEDYNDQQNLLNDFSIMQNAGLLMTTFETDYQEIAEVFHYPNSFLEYENRKMLLDKLINEIKYSTSHKRDMFIQQLEALGYFYDQLHQLLLKYGQSIDENTPLRAPQDNPQQIPRTQKTNSVKL